MAIIRRKRAFIKWVGMFICLWIAGSFYMYSNLDFSLETIMGAFRRLDEARVKEIMLADQHQQEILDPLAEIVLQENLLSFYHLPKRISDRLYTEVTSANRDTSYPLAPDFSFHISYGEREVVLYEDYGPGCVYRIYLFPILPRTANELHKITSTDLQDMSLNLVIDFNNIQFPLPKLMDGDDWPFLTPINTQHPKPSSGMGSYTPICYQDYIKISYHHNTKMPPNLFEVTVNCSKNDLLCPTHIYSAVSRHKFSKDFRVNSFSVNARNSESHPHRRLLRQAVNLLQNPELNGPSKGERCILDCVEMCSGCKSVIFAHNEAGVINAINLRVFETATGKLQSDWTNILLTAHFDSSIDPQIDRVPLGALFGVGGSLNDFKGATVGHRKRYCSYEDSLLDMPKLTDVGYFHFAMPFWRNAKITLTGTEFIQTSLLVCHQIKVVTNSYDQKKTGYFHAKKTYYDTDVSTYREVLSVDSTWGHVVGLFMEVNYLSPVRDVPVNYMWAGLQADAVIFLDGQKAASVLGTGLEDYFSYAHGFVNAENTTYSFVGNYHSEPRQADLLTWHCYRLHILDPIVFHSSIQFIMEGTLGDSFQSPATPLSHEEYMQRRADKQGTFSHTVLYYARAQSGTTLTDELRIGDTISESEHSFKVVRSGQKQQPPEVFYLQGKRYLGACNKEEQFDKEGRQFNEEDKIMFKLRVFEPNMGVVLRREFHSEVGSWNEKAYVWANGVYLGTWFIPMGTLSSEYSLRQEDLIIGAELSKGRKDIEITIAPQTKWRDISYQSLSIHVSS